MPHVIIKMATGRTEEQKAALTTDITKALVTNAKCEESAVTVAIEEIEPAQWLEKVYNHDILPIIDKLYKKPGYKPA